jgi:hypothetical protein
MGDHRPEKKSAIEKEEYFGQYPSYLGFEKATSRKLDLYQT